MLYNYVINRHAGTPSKTKKIKDTIRLSYSSICEIGSSRMKEIYKK